MNTIRGFRIRHKFVKLVKWGLLGRRKQSNYIRLNHRPDYTAKAMSKLCGFACSLKKSAKDICLRKSGSSYNRMREEEMNPVPKGHLVVYVGEKEGDEHRVLVPVIYFNHPLFGDMLREAEKVYGYNYDGGIHVPCRISEFQNVQTKINGDRSRARRNWRLTL